MINFENLPNKTTPLNKTNLNKMQTDLQNQIGDLSNVDWGTGTTKDIANMMKKFFQVGSLSDLNNITTYLAKPTTNASNYPSGLGGNNCFVIESTPGSKFTSQLAFSFGSDAIAIRRKNNSDTWSEWKYFYAEGTNPVTNINIKYDTRITPDVNSAVKCGRIVNVAFRGVLTSAIGGNEYILTGLPKNAAGNVQISGIYEGGHYAYEKPIFGYIDGTGGLKTSGLANAKYVHVNITYITSD